MRVSPRLAGQASAATAALLVYINTVPAGFVFDDHFAVVRNQDVTDHTTPLSVLLTHDFWGQDLDSPQSHKSYRPLTVLFYRVLHKAWLSLPATWLQQVSDWRAGMVVHDIIMQEELPPAGLDPLPFHVINIILHALASALVCRLAYHLFQLRIEIVGNTAVAEHQALLFNGRQRVMKKQDTVELVQALGTAQASIHTGMTPRAGATGMTPTAGATGMTSAAGATGMTSAAGATDMTGGLQKVEATEAVGLSWHVTSAYQLVHLHLPAWLTGIAFAIHPVHTEAVAGIVGAAELLCACAAVPALLCYFAAADLDSNKVAAQQEHKFSTTVALQHQQEEDCRQKGIATATQRCNAVVSQWGYVGLALLLLWAAALCKEIGITVAGCMLVYDLLLAPSRPSRLPADPAYTAAAVMQHEHEQQAEQHARSMQATTLDSEQQQQQPQHGGLRRRKQKASISKDAEDHTCANHASLHQAAAGDAGSSSSSKQWSAAGKPHAPQLAKLLRCVLVVLTVAAYVRTRTMLAGDQLVRIYRKVENPIPFANEPLTRALSTAHLHARYAWLLLWPQHLSADWSFNCVPLVTHWNDPRNAASLILYTYLVLVCCWVRPWLLVAACCKALLGRATGVHTLPSTWRLVVAGGLIVAPFLPASNILFYVGTFIGERLLYTPSIGALVLLAEALCVCLAAPLLKLAGVSHASEVLVLPSVPVTSTQRHKPLSLNKADGAVQQTGGAAHQTATVSSAMANSGTTPADVSSKEVSIDTVPLDRVMKLPYSCLVTASARATLWLASTLVVCLLVMAARRTWNRNWDWLSEEALFVAAQKVCPNSAKVALNSGILARRHRDFTQALAHFTAARQIEPGYCEPGYWIGSTLFNLGDVPGAVHELEAALHCKYVASDALAALHSLYQVLQQAGGFQGAAAAARWGQLLVQPHVGHFAEGCEVLETAALSVLASASVAGSSGAELAMQAVRACAQAITGQLHRTARDGADGIQSKKGSQQAGFEDGLLAERTVQLSGDALQQLLDCVQDRAAVYQAMALHGVESHQALFALYGYLRKQQQADRGGWRCQDAARAWLQRQVHSRTREDVGGKKEHTTGTRSMTQPDAERGAEQWSAADDWLGSVKLEAELASKTTEPSVHMLLIHRFQSGDPDDPWLQQAWASALLQLKGRAADAAVHGAAAAMLFHHGAQQLMSGVIPAAAHGSKGNWRGHALDGTSMDAQQLYDAAADSYMQAVSIAMGVVGINQPSVAGLNLCDMLARGFHARVMTARLTADGQGHPQHAKQHLTGDVATSKFQRDLKLLYDVVRGMGDAVPETCSMLVHTMQNTARELL